MTNYDTALRDVMDPSFLGSIRYDEQQQRASKEGAHPEILEFIRLFVKRMHGLGVPVYAQCVVRDKAEQTRAFVQGNSKAQFGQSPHNYGMAVDLIHGQHAWNLNPKTWHIFGALGKELALQRGFRLEWGGDWKPDPITNLGWDPAHWEIADWKQQKEFYPWIPLESPQATPLSNARLEAYRLWRKYTRTKRQ